MHLAQKLKGDSPSANGDGLGTQYFSFEQLSPHRVLSENRGSRACERPVERVLDTCLRKPGAALLVVVDQSGRFEDTAVGLRGRR